MLRATFTFLSVLAVGVLTAAAFVALMPWISGRLPAGAAIPANGLHFESLILGLLFGLVLGTLGRYNWADLPRRIVTWILVRERNFFYYALILLCFAVLIFY